jgi:hypothetical protein
MHLEDDRLIERLSKHSTRSHQFARDGQLVSPVRVPTLQLVTNRRRYRRQLATGGPEYVREMGTRKSNVSRLPEVGGSVTIGSLSHE